MFLTELFANEDSFTNHIVLDDLKKVSPKHFNALRRLAQFHGVKNFKFDPQAKNWFASPSEGLDPFLKDATHLTSAASMGTRMGSGLSEDYHDDLIDHGKLMAVVLGRGPEFTKTYIWQITPTSKQHTADFKFETGHGDTKSEEFYHDFTIAQIKEKIRDLQASKVCDTTVGELFADDDEVVSTDDINIGDIIKTKKGVIRGTVINITPEPKWQSPAVSFRATDGRLLRTPMSNCVKLSTGVTEASMTKSKPGAVESRFTPGMEQIVKAGKGKVIWMDPDRPGISVTGEFKGIGATGLVNVKLSQAIKGWAAGDRISVRPNELRNPAVDELTPPKLSGQSKGRIKFVSEAPDPSFDVHEKDPKTWAKKYMVQLRKRNYSDAAVKSYVVPFLVNKFGLDERKAGYIRNAAYAELPDIFQKS